MLDAAGLGERRGACRSAVRALFDYQARAAWSRGTGRRSPCSRTAAWWARPSTATACDPARYLVTTDGLVVLASEAGVLDVDEERVLERGRLGPGGLLAVDLEARPVPGSPSGPRARPRRAPAVRRWLAGAGSRSADVRARPPSARGRRRARPARAARASGYTREELQLVLGPMHARRAGAGRLDGRRHAAGGALAPAAPALRATSSSASRR